VILGTISEVTGILNSCLYKPSVKSFVNTGSSAACMLPKQNVAYTVDSNSENEEDIKAAWKPRTVGRRSLVDCMYMELAKPKPRRLSGSSGTKKASFQDQFSTSCHELWACHHF